MDPVALGGGKSISASSVNQLSYIVRHKMKQWCPCEYLIKHNAMNTCGGVDA
jgi:hypothetical protein